MGDDVRITRGNVNVHRDQGRVGSFSRTLDDHRFTFQCDQQMNFKGGKKENQVDEEASRSSIGFE